MHRMNSSRRLLAAVSMLTVVWAWSSPAWSLGLGRPESQAVLGDTLRVVVPLRLEEGETVTQECVSAEVSFGDDRVAPGAVLVELQPAETVTAGMGARPGLRPTPPIKQPGGNMQQRGGRPGPPPPPGAGPPPRVFLGAGAPARGGREGRIRGAGPP